MTYNNKISNVIFYIGVFAGSCRLQLFELISCNTNTHCGLTAKRSPPGEVAICILIPVGVKGYSLNWSICALMWSSHTVRSCLYSLADISWEHRFSTAWGGERGERRVMSHRGFSGTEEYFQYYGLLAVPGRVPPGCTWLKCCSEWPRPPPSASATSLGCSSQATWAFLFEETIKDIENTTKGAKTLTQTYQFD